LVNELVRLEPTIDFVLYIYKPDVERLLPREPNVTIRRIGIPFYPLWEQVGLPIAALIDNLDILHCLGNTAPLLLPNSIKLVLSLMDVMFLQRDEYVPRSTTIYQALGRAYRCFFAPRCARSAQQVITISDYSRHDIFSRIPGLDTERVSISYLACDSVFEQTSALQPRAHEWMVPKRPYILALGAEDPRKNTLFLVKAYLKLLRVHKITEDLVISGYANWSSSEAYRLVRRSGAVNRVRFLSFVSIEQLAALYREAALFVYPSLYEGFGIPLLEAFSSGCPVAASNTTSIPEVGSDAATYFDPLNEDSLGQAILRLIQDVEFRKLMVNRGYARACDFRWSKTAQQTISVYKRCAFIGSTV
jgi:glycosyltransferase involved in cell wall biosynthesis